MELKKQTQQVSGLGASKGTSAQSSQEGLRLSGVSTTSASRAVAVQCGHRTSLGGSSPLSMLPAAALSEAVSRSPPTDSFLLC